MFKLIKTDLKKFIQGKMFLWIVILVIFFPLLQAGLILAIKDLIPEEQIILLNPDYNFYSSFSLLNNFGLIFTIFMIVWVVSEFREQTIRNKVILGYKKSTIFYAKVIEASIVTFITMSLNAILNYLATGIIVGFKDSNMAELLQHYVVMILAVITIIIFIQVVGFIFRTTGLTLGVSLGVIFVFTIVSSVLLLLNNDVLTRISSLILPFNQLQYYSSFKDLDMLWMILVDFVYIFILLFIGRKFNHTIDYR